jgi:hypothetical protein
MFSIPAGCHHTQQDGESKSGMMKEVSSSLSIKSIYMQLSALLIRKLFVFFEFNYRQKCRFQYTILKLAELLLWLTQYSINKFRIQLIRITRVLSHISTKSSILKGYIKFLKVLAGFNPHMQELAKTHKFLFGDYPNGIGLRTDAWTTNNNNK